MSWLNICTGWSILFTSSCFVKLSQRNVFVRAAFLFSKLCTVGLRCNYGGVVVACCWREAPSCQRGSVTFLLLQMVPYRELFMLQGKSIPHICYELLLLLERLHIYTFTQHFKIPSFYLIQDLWLCDGFVLYLLWLLHVYEITNILFIWAVGSELFLIVFLFKQLWKYPPSSWSAAGVVWRDRRNITIVFVLLRLRV